MGLGINIATGNLGAAVSSGVGAVSGIVTSIISDNLTIDNMKNAPSSIQNAKGNALLNVMSTEMGLIVEEYSILPNEKEIINDYMCQNGFTYNRYDNIKNCYNIRKYYNYIEAELDAVSGVSMSNVARTDMKQRFQNGIRFWNSDEIQYSLENYEKWLED